MILPLVAVIAGLVVLVWSAGRFVAGSASAARYLNVPPLLIGMIIVGFGTSAPELFVSGMSAMRGLSGLALGNAVGSNITNIALILGLTALLKPMPFRSEVLRRELPLLLVATALVIGLALDGGLGRLDALLLTAAFAAILFWTVRQSRRKGVDAFAEEVKEELSGLEMSLVASCMWAAIGLLGLVVSSRLLVWGAVEVARSVGVSELIIGLTVVALGTSLPELASSVVAARRGEHDIALGNVLGSNLFNTLAVVALGAGIRPMEVAGDVLRRDLPVMAALTVGLFIAGYGFRGDGRINRFEGAVFLAIYVAYTAMLVTGWSPAW